MPKRGSFGHSGRISSRGVGGRDIRVTALDFGLGIIASSDSEARSRRAFYPVVTTGSSFSMTIVFISYEERGRFTRWMKDYMTSVAMGTATSGIMTIRVPSKNFVRTAVPETEIPFGEGVTDIGYEVTIGFKGASDPVNMNLSKKMAGISYFKGPTDDAESRYFYPAGRQVKGAEALDGSLFDADPTGKDFVPDTDNDVVPGFLPDAGA